MYCLLVFAFHFSFGSSFSQFLQLLLSFFQTSFIENRTRTSHGSLPSLPCGPAHPRACRSLARLTRAGWTCFISWDCLPALQSGCFLALVILWNFLLVVCSLLFVVWLLLMCVCACVCFWNMTLTSTFNFFSNKAPPTRPIHQPMWLSQRQAETTLPQTTTRFWLMSVCTTLWTKWWPWLYVTSETVAFLFDVCVCVWHQPYSTTLLLTLTERTYSSTHSHFSQNNPDLAQFEPPMVNTVVTYGYGIGTPGSFIYNRDFEQNRYQVCCVCVVCVCVEWER